MTAEEFLDHIEALSVWQRRGSRAPHKPLLVLLSLAKLDRGGQRMIPYSDVGPRLGELLEEFGPQRRQQHPEYPFWRLEKDGIWEVEWPPAMRVEERRVDPGHGTLMREGVEAGFTSEVYSLLKTNRDLLRHAAEILLDSHFPRSLHSEILVAVGLDVEGRASFQRRRDPAFREKVLLAYKYRCSVCGFDLRMGQATVAIDGAHIRWKQAGGPDRETNGLALCALHHRLFDRGAFTIEVDLRVRMSQRAVGSPQSEGWLRRFHGKPLEPPQDPAHKPEPRHLLWHRREVFQGPEVV